MLVVQMDGTLIKSLRRELIEMIHRVYPLEPVEAHYFGEVAKRYRYVGTNTEVGFITSVSESFVPLVREREFQQMESFILACLRQRDST